MGTNSGATAGINNKPVGGAAVLGVGVANSAIGGGVLSNSLGSGGGGGLSISGLGGQNANVGGIVTGMGGVGGNNGSDDGMGGPGGGPNNQQATTPQYTIPGILHFIQHEWSRFELERSQWDVDRAELQARIAMLLGERKCLESLKSDLTRRIKMLEYALRQERAKFYRLKYGTDPPQLNEFKPSSNDDGGLGGDVATDSEVPYSSVSNTTWRQGRQMLRQYLAEIGYTDNIIDVRSNRVRSILGLNNNADHDGGGGGGIGGVGSGGIGGENLSPNINGNESNKRASESEGRHTPAKKVQQSNDAIILDTEAAVMANFEFLGPTEMSDDDEISDDLEMVATDNEDTDVKMAKRPKSGKDMLTEDLEAEVGEQLLNDMNLMTEGAFYSSA
ncbi:striatin-3 isoform X3 [Drosophila montana]|uniref:striatin-3 isoform X3 n=1 Tax=Drosophila montana TaxID=40370 RepID=UPI00313DC1B8